MRTKTSDKPKAPHELTKQEIVQTLVETGCRPDLAAQYADAFIEYKAATRNIDAHGIIVAHPRTGAPMENPYLAVRDRALKKLRTMDDVDSDALWT